MVLEAKESHKLDCATVWKIDEGLVHVRFEDGFTINLKDAIKVRDAGIDLVNGGKFLTLIDARNIAVH